MSDEIINRVAQSGLITIDLEDYYQQGERVLIDIKDNLYQGLVLKEKDFRDYLKTTNWEQYQDAYVAICCSADAIVPTWAYMLLASKLKPYAKKVVFGNLDALEQALFQELLRNIKPEEYEDARIVIKGCSKFPVPVYAYVEITQLLLPVATSIMYGEPCSTVPVYKKAKS